MSNIFQPITRGTGVVRFNIGVGAIVDPVKNQGLNLDGTGAVYAVADGTIAYHNAGLPFDTNGRMVVSSTAPDVRYDQLIPFTTSGAVALGDATSYITQSLAFDVTGSLASS